MDRSDIQLIQDYLGGERKAFEALTKRYLRPIYSFVYRYIGDEQEAEDLTQEVFIRVWKNLGRFDKTRSFKTWIFSIAKNASFDALKKKRIAPLAENEIEYWADTSPLPQELLMHEDTATILGSALSRLSPKYRMVLFLRYNDHFTFREIAQSLGEPLNTVRSRHRRALGLLKGLLKKSMHQNERLGRIQK